MPSHIDTKRLTVTALLCAMAIAVQYLEGLLPPPVPGLPVRLGFANIFALYALINGKKAEAFVISFLRSLIVPLFTGAVSGLVYALPASLLSCALMCLLLPLYRKDTLGAVGLSVAGAFLYNSVQLFVGVFAVGQAVLLYFPWMGLLSVPAGVCTGFAAALIQKRVPWRNKARG